MAQNPFISFLSEILQRLFTKSPLFFKVWQIASSLLLATAGIPPLLQALGVNLPDLYNSELNKIIGWAAGAALFMSLLTTQSKPKLDTDGTIYKETNADKLPFTAKNEMKQAVKAEDQK